MMNQDWKHAQNFMPVMNMKDKEEQQKLSDSETDEYIPEEENEEEDHFSVSQQSRLRSRTKTPSVEKRPPLMEETKKNVLRKARTSRFSPTQKVPGDPRKPGGGTSCKRKRAMFSNFDDHEKSSSVGHQIRQIQENLRAEYPIFVKSMIRSNVSTCFCLTLPKQFCHLHLPLHDTSLTLEVESGERYRTTFLAEKRLLSAGWKRFSTANQLLLGDVLVFRLVRPLKFKVCIIGRDSLAELDAAFCLLKLNSSSKQEVLEKNHPMPLPRDVFQGKVQNTSLTLDTNPELLDNHSEDYIEKFGSNSLEDNRFRGSAADFGDVRRIDNFTILVNGVTIDSRLSKQLRANYYDLCCSQRSFLHEHLLKSINSKLAAEIISETTSIANAIRARRLSTSRADYVMWEKTLNAFELLGMNVGFLRAQLKRLLGPSFKSDEAKKSKRYIDAKLEQIRASEEMRALDLKLLELKRMMLSLDAKIEALEEICERR